MSTSGDYRKVTLMMENPSYDGLADGRSRRRPHHRMKPFILVILLLLAVVGVAVALAVILTGNKTNLDVPEEVTILGSLHISNREYRESYGDRSTKEFASLEREVVDAMDRLYNKSLFRNIYVGTSVTEIRKGSVVVDFAIHLEIPKTLFDLKQDEHKKVSAPEYNEAYVHLVKAIDDNTLGEFTIIEFSLSFDSKSLSFQAITLPPVSKTVGQADQGEPTLSPLPTDACNDNPCVNGGTCVLQPETALYFTCKCPEGHSGYLCQNIAPSNPCNSNPCQHGGQCWFGTIDGQDRYTCICPPGYDGQNCGNPKQTQCIDIPIPQCCPFLPYNQTVSPNPFKLTETHEELLEFFELSYHFLTPTCHPDAQRVLCTILNPQCPQLRTAGHAAGDEQASVLDFQLPCRSVAGRFMTRAWPTSLHSSVESSRSSAISVIPCRSLQRTVFVSALPVKKRLTVGLSGACPHRVRTEVLAWNSTALPGVDVRRATVDKRVLLSCPILAHPAHV
ncbi:uncharacterized protein LOC110978295 isoform X1 [Acanthaster planci]|uniref:Uncharacterized protein LOC110978295 isoform X1 n=1 Tax=Acanthaster planci TaxID=133434 RepID=A0A8B7YAZ9_ACAPL|nr:uncharacterized protein LOC110978295 isoform X1 [Acanthaster planci]